MNTPSRDAREALADTPTPKPMEGLWTLVGPDNRRWIGPSPIAALRAEQAERVPADVAMARIMREVDAAPPAEPVQEPVAWVRWDWDCTGMRHLQFEPPDGPLPLVDVARAVRYFPLVYAAPPSTAQAPDAAGAPRGAQTVEPWAKDGPFRVTQFRTPCGEKRNLWHVEDQVGHPVADFSTIEWARLVAEALNALAAPAAEAQGDRQAPEADAAIATQTPTQPDRKGHP